jgi:far upstream element-binding protein
MADDQPQEEGSSAMPPSAAEALARARSIAAKMAAASALPIAGQKRRAEGAPDREDDGGEGGGGGAPGALEALATGSAPSEGGGSGGGGGGGVPRRRRVALPEPGLVDLLLGSGGGPLKQLEAQTGCRILLRGRGVPGEGGEDEGADGGEDAEEAHAVVLAAGEDAAERGERAVAALLGSPEAQLELKKASLRNKLAEAAVTGGDSGGGGGGGADAGAGGGEGGGEAAGGGAASVEEKFSIPNAVAGSVIGRGGENIQAVQARTGTRVSVQSLDAVAAGAQERSVTVAGAPAGVAEAKRLLLQIVEDRLRAAAEGGSAAPLLVAPAGVPGGGALLAPAGTVAGGAASVQVVIPDERAGAVIGRAGGNIKQIQARTGTHINVPREGDAANRAVRTVTISGPSTAHCEAAKAEVLAALHIGGGPGGGGAAGEPGAPGALPPPPPGQTQFQMQVLDDRAGAIIGKGGATIRDLQDRTGCRIQVPNQADPTTGMRNVIITGLPPNVEMAKGEVMAIATGAVRPSPPPGAGAGGYGGGAPYGAPAPYGYPAAAYGGYPMAMAAGGYAAAPAYGGGYPRGPPAVPAANPYAAYAAYYAQAQAQAARPGGGAPGGAAAGAPAAGPAPGSTPEMQAAWTAYYQQMAQYGAGGPPQQKQ